ncbi:hypothetical protein DRE_06639 [Drechslerella stenobrocha 248]|uniref:FAD-binding FR-type domain-containing protein n=1 Tax=Drechslerella stenobrocha 248 TaxID=1043628 RepID=W7HXC7_9PEZI|nr:hypothetical protein DRE_06639 [Drechslerella stenobrocha 248]
MITRPLLRCRPSAAPRLIRAYSYSTASPPSSPRRRPLAISVVSAASLFAGYIGYTYLPSEPTTPINPYTFTPYILTARTALSPSSALLTLAPQHAPSPPTPAHFWPTIRAAGLWSVQVKQPQLQIQREYTPLPPIDGKNPADSDELRLFVRAVPAGEVSGYLLAQTLGDTVYLRGPVVTYAWPEGAAPGIHNVLFIAGGTGISPAVQVARYLHDDALANGGPPRRLTILYASRSSDEQLLPQLQALQRMHPAGDGKRGEGLEVDVRYFYDDKKTVITKSDVEKGVTDLAASGNGGGRDVIMVSGPDGFVRHFAGAKGWKDGVETQGVLGGVLGDILRRQKQSIEVVKL